MPLTEDLIDIIRRRTVLYSQPVRCLRTGTVVFNEVLSRFSRDGVDELPSGWLPYLEEYNLMDKLDLHVCTKLAEYAALKGGEAIYSLNVSGQTINKNTRFSRSVAQVVTDTGMSPDRIIFELTLPRLKPMGVSNSRLAYRQTGTLMQFIDFEPPAIFDDCHGNPRPIPTCSIVGRRKFRQLYNQLIHHLSQRPEVSWERLVEMPAIRPILSQLLDLNGLDIEWLSPNQIQGLLISRHDAEACVYLPGYLVELNDIPRNTEGPETLSPEIVDPPFSISPPQLFPSVVAEFVDRKGIVRPIYALAFAAYREFYERLTFIKEVASGEFTQTWQEMFETQISFRYSCCRCLELNGISPDWVTFHQLEQLLIKRHEDGQNREGWLLTINRLPPPPEPIADNDSDASGTVESIIASLYLQGIPLPEAFDLMKSVPAYSLTLTLREYSALVQKTAPKSATASPTALPTPPPTHRISYEEAERLLNKTQSNWVEVDMDV